MSTSESQKEQLITETIETSSFRGFYTKYVNGLTRILHSLSVETVEDLISDIIEARAANRQIFIFGNGGSAANASHLANDFSKQRFEDERLLFRVISLTDNVSWITATANDVGYSSIFVSQLRNLLQPGDLVIGISSSGNSANVINAIKYANERGATTWSMVGFKGGELQEQAHKSVYIPSKVGQYGFMEDVCSVLTHIMSVYIYEQDRARVNAVATKPAPERKETEIKILDIELK